ncbi:hypothetical protein bcgnr5378_07450 [Bacillus cereus]|uniref:Uncharacterized protein n=1 Tax=Bacillus cereus TaxID=1396 RepID=A0A164NYC8_BACCE|nr:hypothetical protein [Bacillus cereus]KZD65993.1 hypothetical protein B4088_2750 [Bacillus cereus]
MVRLEKENSGGRMARYQGLRNNTDGRIVPSQDTRDTGENEFLIRDKIWYYEKRLSNVNVFYALSWFMNYIAISIFIFDPYDTLDATLKVGLIFAVVFSIRRNTLNKITDLEARLPENQNKF